MRLVTFENGLRQSRIGARTTGGEVVDLNAACALYLRDVEKEAAYYRLADALVPRNMRQLFEGGDTSLETAAKAFDYVTGAAPGTRGCRDENVVYSVGEITLKAPIIP